MSGTRSRRSTPFGAHRRGSPHNPGYRIIIFPAEIGGAWCWRLEKPDGEPGSGPLVNPPPHPMPEDPAMRWLVDWNHGARPYETKKRAREAAQNAVFYECAVYEQQPDGSYLKLGDKPKKKRRRKR